MKEKLNKYGVQPTARLAVIAHARLAVIHCTCMLSFMFIVSELNTFIFTVYILFFCFFRWSPQKWRRGASIIIDYARRPPPPPMLCA